MQESIRTPGEAEEGKHAASRLLPLVYQELRRLASDRLAREPGGQTLQATALGHEAYLRLEAAGGGKHWDHRGHFFAAAAEAMRRILIDSARRKQTPKHGGDRRRIPGGDSLSGEVVAPGPDTPPEDVLALDEALEKFGREEPAKAELVKLRYFAGLTMPEAAEVLGISLATAERHWAYAKTWLYAELTDAGED